MINRKQKQSKEDKDSTSATAASSINPNPVTSIKFSLFKIIINSLIVTLIIFSLYIFITGEPPQFATKYYKQLKKEFSKPKERIFTLEELKQYNGEDETKPIYISIMGNVFDVTKGKEYYGKGKGYNVFAGRDATRSFITGCFNEHLTHDIRGFDENQLKSLDEWVKFYFEHDEYFYVGKVELPEVEGEVPGVKCTKV